MSDDASNNHNIVETYQEALKMNGSDLVLLHQGRKVIFESEDSFINQSEKSKSVKITPGFLSTDDSTVLYGFYVDFNPEANEDYDYQNIIPNMKDFDFININKGTVITLESGSKESSRKVKKSRTKKMSKTTNNKSILSQNQSKLIVPADQNADTSDKITLYASVGGTIRKDHVEKFIPSSKTKESVYMGALGVRSGGVNSILKLYFDRDLHKTANNFLKDKDHQRILIKLSV